MTIMRKLTREEVLKRFKEVHGDRYDYSLFKEYEGIDAKITIICKDHGEFNQPVYSHNKGAGCHSCGYILSQADKRIDEEGFFNRCKDKHGDKFDYNETIFKGYLSKISITCPKHGAQLITAKVHAEGLGCKSCSKDAMWVSRRMESSTFPEKATKIHGDKYSYKDTIYVSAKKNVKIHCNACNEVFFQSPTNHLSGKGCHRCARKALIVKKTKTLDMFISDARAMHGDKYIYPEYNGHVEKCRIFCKTCKKYFDQSAASHLSGSGCFRCASSKGENILASFLRNMNIDFIRQKKFPECRNKRALPFDFYIPEHGILVEYQGIQHYEPVKRFGGEEALKYTQRNDNIKRMFVESSPVLSLIEIRYDQIKGADKILREYIGLTG